LPLKALLAGVTTALEPLKLDCSISLHGFHTTKTNVFQTVQVLAYGIETDRIAQRQAKLLRKRHTRSEETERCHVGHHRGC